MMKHKLAYLGPSGSFTHQAALAYVQKLESHFSDLELQACEDANSIFQHVSHHEQFGVIAWENNVEGYVVPNLDALIDSENIVGIGRIGTPVHFNAFCLKNDFANGEDIADCEVLAHPHGLAQCKNFIRQHHLHVQNTTSNAAACRDLQAGQLALAPEICETIYPHIRVLKRNVQDYVGARTDFLLLAPRNQARSILEQCGSDAQDFESIIAFIPLSTGSGVLANLLNVLRDAGLNMTSFISRPIKGHDGTYSFIATIDAAPWQENLRSVLRTILQRGDWVKTLAVYERRELPNPPVNEWMLPEGGARDMNAGQQLLERQMLW
ncbi:MAG: prephenate dehydratase domain-containing protein [Bifidobacteriaceae bacterium]|nr:prephenate dehydratase domain-containing protein [Bifidobacteriaceae bacterium]